MFKKRLLSSLQKTKSTQRIGSMFLQRIELVKKTKFELESEKSAHCFLNGYGNYDINLNYLRIKSLYSYHFLQSVYEQMNW